jgi:hypothetical protein
VGGKSIYGPCTHIIARRQQTVQARGQRRARHLLDLRGPVVQLRHKKPAQPPQSLACWRAGQAPRSALSETILMHLGNQFDSSHSALRRIGLGCPHAYSGPGGQRSCRKNAVHDSASQCRHVAAQHGVRVPRIPQQVGGRTGPTSTSGEATQRR